jgi:hypothetical protein
MRYHRGFAVRRTRTSFVQAGCLSCLFLLTGCAGTNPRPTGFQYRFNEKRKEYRIRSIVSRNKSESCNELFGNTFWAVDFDQDGVLDQIVLGGANLAEAQKTYETGLDLLARENKLQNRVSEVASFKIEDPGFEFEIKSFRPVNAPPFNEFKMTDKRASMPSVSVSIDDRADGSLDALLTGRSSLESLQSRYQETIRKGLGNNVLIRTEAAILVKTK